VGNLEPTPLGHCLQPRLRPKSCNNFRRWFIYWQRVGAVHKSSRIPGFKWLPHRSWL